MTTIYLVRHGESAANVKQVFSNGRLDLPLTALGRRQAQQAAVWLHGRDVAHVFSAPLLRARQTAGVIAAALDARCTVLADLDEVRVGDLDGRRDAASWAVYDCVIERWRAGERAAAFPGGESYGQAHDRYAAALRAMAARFPESSVIAVTHGAIQLTVLPRLCPPLGEGMRCGAIPWGLANAAITTLEVSPDGFACAAWSETGHLVAALPGV